MQLVDESGQISKLVPDFMHVRVTCMYKDNSIKNYRVEVETLFSSL